MELNRLIAGQSIDDILALLWVVGAGTLALGVLLAALAFFGSRSGRLGTTRKWFLYLSSIALDAGAIGTLLWVNWTHDFQFTYRPQMNVSVDRRPSIRTHTWEHAIPSRVVFRAEWIEADSHALRVTGHVLNRLSMYARWVSFFDRLRASLPFRASYRVSHRLRLQANLADTPAGGATATKDFGPAAGKSSVSRIDMATVTLASSLSAQDRVRLWPSRPFSIDCTGSGSPVALRPASHWIADLNLREHETFTLPVSCTRGGTVSVDVHLSEEEKLEDYSRLSIKIVQVEEAQEQSPRLSAYVGTASLRPGDALPIRINASGPVSIEVSRLGAESQIVHSAQGIAARPQRFSALLSFREGVNWDVTHGLTIPASWRPGYYVARIARGEEQFFAYFLVSHARGDAPPPVAILVPTNTWQAYNRWGGGSFYRLDLEVLVNERQGHQVSMRRPIPMGPPEARDQKTHLVQSDLEIARWLERSGYGYTVYTDEDLHAQPDLLLPHRLLVIPTNSKYWSDEMVLALQRYLDKGGNVASLGGNAIYQRVTINDGVMEGYNHRQFHQHDGRLGGFFYLQDRPQSALLGVQYDTRGYNSYAPYVVRAGDHWALMGTGLRNGNNFGVGNHGEALYFASGGETDKATRFSPRNLTLLAEGANERGGAMMTIYDHPGGGFVYAAGSLAYSSTLNLDARQGKILDNVIARALASR